MLYGNCCLQEKEESVKQKPIKTSRGISNEMPLILENGFVIPMPAFVTASVSYSGTKVVKTLQNHDFVTASVLHCGTKAVTNRKYVAYIADFCVLCKLVSTN